MILFTVFFLEEAGDEHHVNSAAPTSKATLGLWHDNVNNMSQEPLEYDVSKYFNSYRQQGDDVAVPADLPVTLPFVNGYNIGIFPLLW